MSKAKYTLGCPKMFDKTASSDFLCEIPINDGSISGLMARPPQLHPIVPVTSSFGFLGVNLHFWVRSLSKLLFAMMFPETGG